MSASYTQVDLDFLLDMKYIIPESNEADTMATWEDEGYRNYVVAEGLIIQTENNYDSNLRTVTSLQLLQADENFPCECLCIQHENTEDPFTRSAIKSFKCSIFKQI